MNIFIAMVLAAAALNIVSACLLIYAAINVRKLAKLNAQIAEQLGLRTHDR